MCWLWTSQTDAPHRQPRRDRHLFRRISAAPGHSPASVHTPHQGPSAAHRHRDLAALLAQCVVEVPETLPPLTTRDHIVLLYLWNHCYESIRGEARTNLKELAKRTGTDQFAKELLHARLLRRRLLAIVTLGHLQERSIWNDLAAMLQVDNAFVSLVAAKALLQIDAKEAIPLLVPVLSRRNDWSPLKVVAMFEPAGADITAEAIAKAACQRPPSEIGAA